MSIAGVRAAARTAVPPGAVDGITAAQPCTVPRPGIGVAGRTASAADARAIALDGAAAVAVAADVGEGTVLAFTPAGFGSCASTGASPLRARTVGDGVVPARARRCCGATAEVVRTQSITSRYGL